MFNAGKFNRLNSLNATGIIIFRSLRDSSNIAFFARQVLPSNWKELVKVYIEQTSEPYSYVYFDFDQSGSKCLRFCTNILSSPFEVFASKDDITSDKTIFRPGPEF